MRREVRPNTFNIKYTYRLRLIGVEPGAGPKTMVMGFPRVVVECLLALAKHTPGWTASESVNMHEVGKAKANEPPRAPHADTVDTRAVYQTKKNQSTVPVQ
jgi:hypothetical protein